MLAIKNAMQCSSFSRDSLAWYFTPDRLAALRLGALSGSSAWLQAPSAAAAEHPKMPEIAAAGPNDSHAPAATCVPSKHIIQGKCHQDTHALLSTDKPLLLFCQDEEIFSV